MSAKTRATGLPDGLARTRPMVSAAMGAAVDRLPELLRVPVAYHMGLAGADGRPGEARGGKAIRPAITLLAAEAAGGRAADALPGAVALELVHNFSLLHDDVMDGDRERRHRPTVWSLFGIGQAIVSGDALFALATELLLETGRQEAAAATSELIRATAQMIHGQAEDLAFESRLDVTEAECLAMSAHKTAALLSCGGVMGGLLGGGTTASIEALRGFGWELGVAFQAVDDLLGIWGDPELTGKPVASDLRQHKKTIPVVHALRGSGPAAGLLRRALANGEPTEAALSSLIQALEETGTRDWTTEMAEAHLRRALDQLERAPLAAGPVAELRDIALFVTGRDF